MSRLTVKSLLTIFFIMALAGCQQAVKTINDKAKQVSEATQRAIEAGKQASQKGANNGGGAISTGDGSTNGLSSSFAQSGLIDIFVNAPYNESRKQDPQWPRVAIRVLKSPANYNKPFYNGLTDIPAGCFEMQATIWRSASNKKTSKPFKWCAKQDLAYGTPLLSYNNWASGWKIYQHTQKNSGARRTSVLPPLTFVPNNVKYKRALGMNTGPTTYNVDSVIGLMVYSIAAQTGIDPALRADHRLWFTKIAPVE